VNPLVHGELSWLAAQKLNDRRDRLLVTVGGVIPDLDGLSLLGGVDAYARWHHVLTHGALSAVLLCGVVTFFARNKLAVFLLGLAAFHLHLVCDLLGSGPGWPLYYLWPFSRAETYWSGQWDLASWQNTLIGLVTTLLVLACAKPFGRTIVELFSVKYDADVVKVVRKWLGTSA